MKIKLSLCALVIASAFLAGAATARPATELEIRAMLRASVCVPLEGWQSRNVFDEKSGTFTKTYVKAGDLRPPEKYQYAVRGNQIINLTTGQVSEVNVMPNGLYMGRPGTSGYKVVTGC